MTGPGTLGAGARRHRTQQEERHMNQDISFPPRWTTAAFGASVQTSATELFALRRHRALCDGARGWLFPLRCAVDAALGFVGTRLVTTVATLALVVRLSALAW
jgi:hypothetical protein